MNPDATPREIYGARLAERTRRLSDLAARRNRIGYVRLLIALAAVVLIWFAVRGLAPAWPIVLPLAVFIGLVWLQSRIERDAECMRRSILFHERGIGRLEHRWQGGGETGERFSDPHHPYAADLDLFGRGSMFELLSIARTRGGESRLAAWLKSSPSVEELRVRHAAVEELRPLLDLRERLAVLGDDFRTGVNPENLAAWASAPAHSFPAWRRLVAPLLAIIAAIVLGWWFATWFIGIDSTRALFATALIEGSFIYTIWHRIRAIVNQVSEPAHDLNLLSQILETLETRQFQSPRLAALRAAIDVRGRAASRRIGRLRRLMELFDSRDNFIVRTLDGPLMWTVQIAMAIEAWRAENGSLIPGWLDAVSEIEALSCLANYAWEHPADPIPEFAEGAVFDAEDLGHPLVAEERCVRNSVALVAPRQLLVVSGSNMSGKSTLLRAVGVNTVLALSGAPVRATRLTISRVSLGASIRTMDSLEEGHSRFMAEILRLKQILELPPPALFLLDELLHGTNSHDRAIGAEGLIRALLKRGAIGLATTHDLALARIAEELSPVAENVHFEDRLEGGRLVFDYRVRAGVVARSNALDLMRAVGLDV
jgi:MutS domain V